MIKGRKDIARQSALDTLMTEHAYSSSELADITGYHEVTIRRWRCGHQRMPERTWKLIRIAVEHHTAA